MCKKSEKQYFVQVGNRQVEVNQQSLMNRYLKSLLKRKLYIKEMPWLMCLKMGKKSGYQSSEGVRCYVRNKGENYTAQK